MRRLLLLSLLLLLSACQPRPDLHDAAARGDLVEIRELLNDGTPVDSDSPLWRTAMHEATRGNQVASARLLHERGASLDPLLMHYAGGAEVAAFLLEQGIDPDTRDEEGHTALYTAIVTGRAETARFLIDHGQRTIQEAGRYRHHALEYAASRCHLDAMRVVLESGLVRPEARLFSYSQKCQRELDALLSEYGLLARE